MAYLFGVHTPCSEVQFSPLSLPCHPQPPWSQQAALGLVSTVCVLVGSRSKAVSEGRGRKASQLQELPHAGPLSSVLVHAVTLVGQVKDKHAGHSGGSGLAG